MSAAADAELKKLQAQIRQAKKMVAKHAPAVRKYAEGERAAGMSNRELEEMMDRNRPEAEALRELKDEMIRHNLLHRTSTLARDAAKGRDAEAAVRNYTAELEKMKAEKKKTKGKKTSDE